MGIKLEYPLKASFDNIVVAKLPVNPFVKRYNDNGELKPRLEQHRQSGEILDQEELYFCGEVLAVSKSVKDINVGEYVFFTTYQSTAVPIHNDAGYEILCLHKCQPTAIVSKESFMEAMKDRIAEEELYSEGEPVLY